MGRTRRALLVVGLLAGTLVATVVPTAQAGSALAPADAVGFTTLRTEAGCELQRLDMATGQLTDLPAPPLPEACVVDLAAAPDGQVYGVVSGFSSVPDEPGLLSLVTFGSDGSPVLEDLPIVGGGGYALGALAISPDGTFYVMGNSVVPGDDGPVDCVPGAIFYCLYTLDPVTLAVTPLGGEGGMDTEYQWLTYCTSGLFAAVVSSGTDITGLDPDTGLVLPHGGPFGSQPFVRGFDCAVGDDTLYAINGPVVNPEVADEYPPIPPETPLTILTLDLTTNTYTRIAELSSPTAAIYNLAVVAAAPVPSTTTTTSGAAAADDVVTAPAFTG